MLTHDLLDAVLALLRDHERTLLFLEQSEQLAHVVVVDALVQVLQADLVHDALSRWVPSHKQHLRNRKDFVSDFHRVFNLFVHTLRVVLRSQGLKVRQFVVQGNRQGREQKFRNV